MSRAPLRVVAAALCQGGELLLAQRRAGSHLAGMWEFPGGKCEAGESELEALRRELIEELGIVIESAEAFVGVPWRYREKSLHLLVYRVSGWSGQPHGREGQAIRWCAPQLIDPAWLAPADREVLVALLQR